MILFILAAITLSHVKQLNYSTEFNEVLFEIFDEITQLVFKQKDCLPRSMHWDRRFQIPDE